MLAFGNAMPVIPRSGSAMLRTIALVCIGSILLPLRCETADISTVVSQVRVVAGRARHLYLTAQRDETGWIITAIQICSQEDTGVSMKELSGLKTIEELRFGGDAGATDQGWRIIGSLPRLRAVRLADNSAWRTLECLKDVRGLELLDAGGARRLEDVSVARLRTFRKLRCLRLPSHLECEFLDLLDGLGELEELSMPSSSMSDDALAAIIASGRLRVLELYALGPKSFEAIKHTGTVHTLIIAWPGKGMQDLSSLTSVKRLKLGQYYPVILPRNTIELTIPHWNVATAGTKGAAFAGQLPPNLESVRIRSRACVDMEEIADFEWFQKLPCLRELALEWPRGKEIRLLTGIQGLRKLVLTKGGWLVNDDMVALWKCNQLEELVIEQCGQDVGDDGMRRISAMNNLRRLELGWAGAATPAMLAGLWRLGKLQTLGVTLPENTKRDDMQGIGNLHRLHELRLYGIVSDEILAEIKQLKGLQKLYLGCEGYSDAGLARLVDELPELRMLQWSVFSDAPRATKDR